ncbi:HIT domain-containing protein [Solwaraspora sp. WMMD792]|uniref:HIT family protein n=1 Tax=Solwaraspora sp. WMMD792 TaxID=3016099 RepID=UPI002417E46C|nr:HIT domain-containing protein [Solwaraspora sp. WMMD792]MDG4771544.1 HIT domain-containing protein [Solwaraspora sp. WMMD792]
MPQAVARRAHVGCVQQSQLLLELPFIEASAAGRRWHVGPTEGCKMELHEDLSADCLFCRRDDEQVNRISHENSTCFARLDNFPAVEGHTEIVPKRHVESFFDLTPQEVRDAYELILVVRDDLTGRLRPDGYTIGVNEGRAAGRSIDHLHIHVIPRRFGDVEDPAGGIRQILPNCDPQTWAAATAEALGRPGPLLR